MGLSTIIQPPFRVSLKNELSTYLTYFMDGSLIFCDEDAQWYCKNNGIVITAESGFYSETVMSNNAVPTVIASILNYTKVLGTTIQGAVSGFTMIANNKVTCTTPVSKTYVIDVTCSIQNPNGNNQAMYLAIFKNGIVVPSSEKPFTNVSTNQLQDVTTGCIIGLNNNDYIEVFVKNTTGLNNLLIKNLLLKIN